MATDDNATQGGVSPETAGAPHDGASSSPATGFAQDDRAAGAAVGGQPASEDGGDRDRRAAQTDGQTDGVSAGGSGGEPAAAPSESGGTEAAGSAGAKAGARPNEAGAVARGAEARADTGANDAGAGDAGGDTATAKDAGARDAGGDTATTKDAGTGDTGGDTATAKDARAGDATGGDASTADAEGPRADGEGKKKRKRRRRRKRKKGEAAQAGAEEGAKDASAHAKKGKAPERPAFNVGDEIFGRVSKVTPSALWLEVAGGKAQGLYDRDELIQVPPQPGEQFIARVKSFSSRGGMLMLGRELWDTTQSRAELRAALEAGQPLECFVTGAIKGGVEVDYKGVRAFAPASHVEIRPGADLGPLVGEKLPFVVTQYGKKGRDVVVSRKDMIEAERKEKRDAALSKLAPGMRVEGVVRNVLQWGAFVALPDYDDVEGVVHMHQASHDRSAKLQKVLSPGSKVELEVLEIDPKGKLWLSRKATQTDPWEGAAERYPTGSIQKGQVVRLTDFGAFVQLEPGIDGLCHVSDLAPFQNVDHPKEAVKQGDELEVVIVNLDTEQRKVTLHPAPPADERDEKRIGRVSSGQKVQAVVMQIRDAGLGMRIVGATGRHAKAFMPASQTGTPKGADLRKEFPLGKRVEAKVIDDGRRGEPRLSVRALKHDAERQAYREYRKKVQREATFGTFGDLLKGKL